MNCISDRQIHNKKNTSIIKIDSLIKFKVENSLSYSILAVVKSANCLTLTSRATYEHEFVNKRGIGQSSHSGSTFTLHSIIYHDHGM